jgi:hypothetical protein
MIAFAVTAQGQPSPTVRYLMNEPLTLFEWGMFRLQNGVEMMQWDGLDLIRPRPQIANVEYDWDKNQLMINLTIYPRYRSLQKSTPKKICGEVIHQMKGLFGVLTPDDKLLRDAMGVGSFFTHKYFRSPAAPQSLAADIERITNLRVDVMTSVTDTPPFQQSQSCSSDLLKSEVLYFTVSRQ